MVIVESRHLLWNDRLIFFPSETECGELVRDIPFRDIVRIQYTPVRFDCDQRALAHSQVMRTWCIDLTKDLDAIYGEMHKDACRRRIKKAEKMLSSILIRRNDQISREDFFSLYNRFVTTKMHTKLLSRKRFEEYLGHAEVFAIYHDGRVVCANLTLPDTDRKRVFGAFSASIRLNGGDDAMLASVLGRYLTWHEIRMFKAEGMEIYDFGGISLGGPITQYKMSYGGFPLEEYCHVFAGGMIPRPVVNLGRRVYRMMASRYRGTAKRSLHVPPGRGERNTV